MSAGRSIFFVGGVRSGKSDMAQRWAEAVAGQRVFVATTEVGDEETARRVARHQLKRGGGWSTLEAPLGLVEKLADLSPQTGVVVVDCITMWLSNLMAQNVSDQRIFEKVEALGDWIVSARMPVALVSCEVGQGIVPVTALGRRYRDLQGEANQILAASCACVIMVHCGLPLALKGKIPEELCAFI